jgi:hypothetical protein
MKIEKHVEKTRSDPARHIKEEIGEVPEEVLDVVSEDPQKKHVSGDMQEAGMEKHAGNQG